MIFCTFWGCFIIIIIIIIIIYSLRVFYISFSWWSFTGVWVTACLLRCSGFFSVFWPFSIMLYFGLSPLVLLPSSPPVPLIILWWLYQKHLLLLLLLFLTGFSHQRMNLSDSKPSQITRLLWLLLFYFFESFSHQR